MSSRKVKTLHYRTSALEYSQVLLSNIPTNVVIEPFNYLPTTNDISNMDNPPLYITYNNDYYKLQGKTPENLEIGQLAISFKENFEAILLKNNNGKIVRIPVNNDLNNNNNNTARIAIFYNDAIPSTDVYAWTIDFDDIERYNINPNVCHFVIKDVFTGNQLLTQFNTDTQNRQVVGYLHNIPSEGIAANRYMLICTGLSIR